jgi:hypothetical protein
VSISEFDPHALTLRQHAALHAIYTHVSSSDDAFGIGQRMIGYLRKAGEDVPVTGVKGVGSTLRGLANRGLAEQRAEWVSTL